MFKVRNGDQFSSGTLVILGTELLLEPCLLSIENQLDVQAARSSSLPEDYQLQATYPAFILSVLVPVQFSVPESFRSDASDKSRHVLLKVLRWVRSAAITVLKTQQCATSSMSHW